MELETLRLHCTTCPSECELVVQIERSDTGCTVTRVEGNRCPRGEAFARQEIARPMRILTTTVPVSGSDLRLIPVRTREAIPRDLHQRAMEVLKSTRVHAPVRMGDVVLGNLLETGVDVIASLDATVGQPSI